MNIAQVEKSDIEKQWHARGFSCGMWIDHARRVWQEDWHDTDELFMAIAGELEIEMGGRCIRPKIGEEVLIPARVQHTVKNVGKKTARWLYGLNAPAFQPVQD